ncbi:MAG TPA: hypothetical protein VGI10_30670 [Polyangiaceae bacterium]|jgi:hypothetical protein
MTQQNRSYFPVFSRAAGLVLSGSLLAGCTLEHHAPLRAAELPPIAPPVLHSSRLWIELADGTPETQCVRPETQRTLCFERVQSTFRQSLQRALWTSFPAVEMYDSGTRLASNDYLLVVELNVEALSPDATGPGWSAGARGKYRLLRGGKTLVAEGLASRSRSEFAYGEPLALGAAEAVEAIATRIGLALDAVPESHEVAPLPLPAVAVMSLPTELVHSDVSGTRAGVAVTPNQASQLAAPTEPVSNAPASSKSGSGDASSEQPARDKPSEASAPVAGL